MTWALTEISIDGGKEEWWSISDMVRPYSSTSKTDVMLIQSMLEMFFLSDMLWPDEKQKAMQILLSDGKKFVDGYYGPKTRDAVRLFEVKIQSPYRDGIIRSLGDPTTLDARHPTKMQTLNDFRDLIMIQVTAPASRQEQGRLYLPQPVYAEMYGSAARRKA